MYLSIIIDISSLVLIPGKVELQPTPRTCGVCFYILQVLFYWNQWGEVWRPNNELACTAPENETESEVPGKKPRQGITSEIIKELTDCNIRLSGQRKKRQV